MLVSGGSNCQPSQINGYLVYQANIDLIEVGVEDVDDWIQDEPRLTVQHGSRLRS